MPRLSMLPILLDEYFGKRSLPREPEPDLVMDDKKQVNAYTEAGRIDGVMAAAYLFHSAHISLTISGSKKVVDLGCGPATQLAQVASLNPETKFIGVDLSTEMLAQAEKHIKDLNLKNVDFYEADITDLKSISNHSIDGAISTMALHHLPSYQHLENCFFEIKRILKNEGALYLTDFGRLKSLKSVIYFAYLNAAHQPHIFSLDYERSLRAAFLADEFKQLTEKYFMDHVKVYPMKPVPVLVLIKTVNRSNIQHSLITQLKLMQDSLRREYRTDLNDIRLLFKFGGVEFDPFK